MKRGFRPPRAYEERLILLASNRAAIGDRMTLEHAAHEAGVEERQNEELLTGNRHILERVEALEKRILQLESTILARLDAPGA